MRCSLLDGRAMPLPDGIAGAELAERARNQACRFGAEILLGREGVRGEFTPGKRIGHLADGTKLAARAVICATGIDYRRLLVENEDRFYGAGVYYGAGASEAAQQVHRALGIRVAGGDVADEGSAPLAAQSREPVREPRRARRRVPTRRRHAFR